MIARFVRALRNPQIIYNIVSWRFLTTRVAVHNAAIRKNENRPIALACIPEIAQIEERKQLDTDISDHLLTLFAEAVNTRPRLIVELGVRGGDSTFVLERAARFCRARLISVDIADCSKVSTWDEWLFVQSDDIDFATRFPDYCTRNGIMPTIDVLFIDTSHLYDHTVQELATWLPLVSERGKVLFHDTNQCRLGHRKDGRLMAGIDNRGVIAAIEGYLGRKFDQTQDFVDVCNGWLIRHIAYSNGFTIMEKLS
jgi:cephalosporin hydroxylase